MGALAGKSAIRIGRGRCVEHFGPGEPYMPVLAALTDLGRGPVLPSDSASLRARLASTAAVAAYGRGAHPHPERYAGGDATEHVARNDAGIRGTGDGSAVGGVA
jgi:hypothetical protein